MKVRNESYKVSRTWSNTTTNTDWDYEDGIIFTPQGIVHAYSQGNDAKKFNPHTYMRMIFKGRIYMQSFKRRCTKRGLSIMAGKFARSVCK